MSKQARKRPDRRPTYPLAAEIVASLQALLKQGLQGNAPVAASIDALAKRLKLEGYYEIRISASFVPGSMPTTDGNPS